VSTVGQHEIRTQRSVIEFFTKALDYSYLGHWKERDGNSAIEETLLTNWLKRQGHSDKIIS
jgi:type I restriction enzyme R subunit